MILRRFLSVVPRKVQLWAWAIVGCGGLIGVAAGYYAAAQGGGLRAVAAYSSAALLVGIVMALWLLCLGFVYADAQRRAMRPILWVLVAALFPHLLGFLLYFVLRQPIASTCAHCGMAVPLGQRFCSWCGSQVTATAGGGGLTTDPVQGTHQ